MRNVRYIDRSKFVKGASDLDDAVALVKFGEMDGAENGLRKAIANRDELRAFLTAEKLATDVIERAVDEMQADEMAFPFTLSTSAEDRQGDVIDQSGWKLDNYKRNPVMLWAHDYGQLPVGRASAVYVMGNKLKAVDRFSNDHELAKQVATLYAKGFLSAVSVGFRPLKWSWAETRGAMAADFAETELLEHSAVPVPAHQDALIEARSAGLAIDHVVVWAEKALASTGGLYLPEGLIKDALVRAKGGPRILVDLGDRKAPKVEDVPEATTSPAPVVEPTLKDALEIVKAHGLAVVTPDVLEQFRKAVAPSPKTDKDAVIVVDTDAHLRCPSCDFHGPPDAFEVMDPDEMKAAKIANKAAISFASAHPHGTPVADRSEAWDGNREVAAADVVALKAMCAWYDPANKESKTAYKLPHHKEAGKHAVVWRGVTAAMGALLGARGGLDIPDADRRGVYNHLAKHYRDDFEQEPPAFGKTYSEDEVKAIVDAPYPLAGEDPNAVLDPVELAAIVREVVGESLAPVRARLGKLLTDTTGRLD